MNFVTCVSQCRPGIEGGERAACPDSVQDGNDNATILRAQFQDNGRCVEYIRPMTATGKLAQSTLSISIFGKYTML